MTLAIGILMLEVGVIVHLLAYTALTGISPVPTTPRVKSKMLDAAPRRIEGTILELGSGWGSLAFALARKYPHSRVVGYELSPIPWCFCRARLWFGPRPNLFFKCADFRKVPLDNAGLIVCYLFPRGMRDLRPRFERELKPGCMVISNSFGVPGWRADRVHHAEDQYSTPVYVYQMHRIDTPRPSMHPEPLHSCIEPVHGAGQVPMSAGLERDA